MMQNVTIPRSELLGFHTFSSHVHHFCKSVSVLVTLSWPDCRVTRSDKLGQTALHLACERGHGAVVGMPQILTIAGLAVLDAEVVKFIQRPTISIFMIHDC